VSVSEWREYTVKELVDLKMLDKPLDGNHGGMHPKSSDYVTSGIPFIMANDLKDGKVDYKCCNFITEKQAKTLKKGFAKPGDVLLTHKATMGRTAIVDESYPYIVLTPQVTYYRVLKGIDNKYLKYYFDSKNFQELLLNWGGSGSTRAYLGITEQLKLPIILPPLPEQKAIAATLSALDDMIELNNQINKILEEMVQAIFKSWFVDFEPFKDEEFEESELGLIPKGWRVAALDEIATYLNGLAMQKYPPSKNERGLPVLKIKELRQGFTDGNSDICSESIDNSYIINDGDIIFSWSGSLLVDIWCGGRCGLNQHLFKVTSASYNKWFYYMWTRYHLERFIAIAKDKATTMGHIQRKHLSEAKVLIPEPNTLAFMDSVMQPIIDLVIANKVENKTLSTIRDTLLPKLMTGEIRVPVEEVV